MDFIYANRFQAIKITIFYLIALIFFDKREIFLDMVFFLKTPFDGGRHLRRVKKI